MSEQDEMGQAFSLFNEAVENACRVFAAAWQPIFDEIEAVWDKFTNHLKNETSAHKKYAALINHGKPRKVSWRKLNLEQRSRALELAKIYGW